MKGYNEYIRLQHGTVQDTSMERVRNFDDMALKFHVKFCTIFWPMLLNGIISSSSSSRYLKLALPQEAINCTVTRVCRRLHLSRVFPMGFVAIFFFR